MADPSTLGTSGSHMCFATERTMPWRMRIRRMLEKEMSLDEIAEKLNEKGVRAPHGRGRWSAATVRKAFVS